MNASDFLRFISLGMIEDRKIEWKYKYDFVFSHDFKQLIVNAIGAYKASDLHWSDPDSYYEEDTKAYLRHILELV